MAEQKKPEHLDELLDSLLSTYSDAEPRPGMETRLLASLRSESAAADTSRRWPWRWFLAGAGVVAFAALLFAMYLSQVRELPRLPEIKTAGPPSLPANLPAHESGRQLRRRRMPAKDSASVGVADVRQEVFPVRTPLSEQERLLFRYLAETPPEEVAAHSHADEPAEPSLPLGPQSQELNETEVQNTR